MLDAYGEWSPPSFDDRKDQVCEELKKCNLKFKQCSIDFQKAFMNKVFPEDTFKGSLSGWYIFGIKIMLEKAINEMGIIETGEEPEPEAESEIKVKN